MANYYDDMGGCSTSVLPPAGQNSFAVAKKIQGGYLGIEERQYGSSPVRWELRLWQSSNLISWTLVQTLRTISGGWNAGDLHYPIFYDASGQSNEIVDANNFYIVGAYGSQGALKKMRVHN